MPHGGVRRNSGGRRPGAGRPQTATTRKTRALADQLASDGEILPLDVMILTMRELWAIGTLEARKEACVIAREASPYLHPRLAARQAEEGNQANHEQWLWRLMAEGLLDRPSEPVAIECHNGGGLGNVSEPARRRANGA